MRQKEHIHAFVRKIWHWYAHNKRDLPWRDLWEESEESRAYKVLVSEVMLQQTQVERVIPIYKRFLDQFSSTADLAKASNRDVIMAWRGMGYNRRALMLRDAAKYILERAGNLKSQISTFPKEMEELQSLPGVGPYTAAAIRNFAFNIPTPCLDTNIRRVLHRTFVDRGEPDDRYLLKLAARVLNAAIVDPASHGFAAASWHHALMDYGALVEIAGKVPRVKKEPGRLVGSRFIPNRIFRGKIIDVLRDMPAGLSLNGIGKRVAPDWDEKVHREWLQGLLCHLTFDRLVSIQGRKFLLSGGE